MKFSDDFDKAKSEKNKRERGMDFVEARIIWADEEKVTAPAKLVGGETRTATIGMVQEKLWVAIWTDSPTGIRIISVRRAEGTPFERKYYENK